MNNINGLILNFAVQNEAKTKLYGDQRTWKKIAGSRNTESKGK